jgi:flagellar basal-body rod modification protein FlgD
MELSQIMGKDDFMKMFLAQIKCQNPLEPMNGLEFTSQLAQFSTLEQLQNANSKIDTLISQDSTGQASLAVSFIGKEITTAGDILTVAEGDESQTLKFSLASDATDVTIQIKDAKGNVVADLDQGALSSGSHTCCWDGKDKTGNTVPAGNYCFVVSAKDISGDAVWVNTFSTGKVTGVSFVNGVAYLEVNGCKVGLSDILSIT